MTEQRAKSVARGGICVGAYVILNFFVALWTSPAAISARSFRWGALCRYAPRQSRGLNPWQGAVYMLGIVCM